MRGVIVGWVPPSLPPPFIKDPPLIIASKCHCPYANRISEAFRTDCVHKSMFLRSTTKLLFLVVLTTTHISEAFRMNCVNKSMLLRSTTKPPILKYKSMLLRSTTKPPILGVLTKHHISEAFRIDVVNKSMLLRSKTKPHFVSIRGGF